MRKHTNTTPRCLLNRTSVEWCEKIIMLVPEHARVKVACTVWWDFVDKKGFKLTPHGRDWFRKMLDSYVMEQHELSREELSKHMRTIGYTEGMSQRFLTVKWWDDPKVREEQVAKMRERNRSKAYEEGRRIKTRV